MLACLAGWLGGALADRVADEDRAFLPTDGTAADFDALRSRLVPPAERRDTATVVVTSQGAQLDEAALAQLRALGARLASDAGLPVTEADEPVLAPDHELAFLDLRMEASEDPGPAVERIRAAAREALGGDGRTVMVTGGAAADADLGTGDVDLWLLLVSAGVVACILAVAYRSLVLWLLPVSVGVVAVVVSHGLSAVLAATGVGVTDLAASIATVVVFGVSTDYALLLLNRLRGTAATGPGRAGAVAGATVAVRTPIAVSAGIIALVVMTLVISPVPGMRALGPVLAVGVVTAAFASLTLLPALLTLLPGRGRPAPQRPEGVPSRWQRLADAVVGRPGRAAVVSAVLLSGLALGGLEWRSSADPLGQIPDGAESKRGAQALRDHLGSGGDATVSVIVADDAATGRAVVARVAGLGAVPASEPRRLGAGQVLLDFELPATPYTDAWSRDLDRFTAAVRDVAPDAAVGGTAVEAVERDAAATRQLWRVAPVLLLVLVLVLTGWLRSLASAAVIVASSCVSCLAAWGVTALVSPALSDSDTVAAEVLLFGFLFLVAFGVDYVVFLVDGIRRAPVGSASARVAHGLAATGPVITAAGAVLAATFATLLLLPEANVRQVGILVAVGVVIDTLIVRVLFVPAMLMLVGAGRWGRTGAAPSPVADLPRPVLAAESARRG